MLSRLKIHTILVLDMFRCGACTGNLSSIKGPTNLPNMSNGIPLSVDDCRAVVWTGMVFYVVR